MFYVFHGPDELTCSETLAKFKAQVSPDPSMADLNTNILDGQSLSLGQLREACDALPFMSDRRLVIVHGYLTRLGSDSRGKSDVAAVQALSDYLENLSPSVRLVFVENETLPKNHPILRLAKKREDGYVQFFEPPSRSELTDWVVQRVKAKGAAIEYPAANALAAAVGEDPRLLDSEIEKLITYVGGSAPIVTMADVELMVSYSGQTNIFTLVDAIGRRDGKTAFRMLHKLLDENEHPLKLLGMIVRQFRILVQVKELSAQKLAVSTIAKRTGLHPFVAEKAKGQILNFSIGQLETIYAQLLNTDLAIKTGKIEETLALDMLVATLCGPPD